MRPRRAALALVLAASLPSSLPQAAAAPPKFGTEPTGTAGAKLFGVNEGNSWRSVPPRATPDQLASELSTLGAEGHRWQLDWQAVEPLPPIAGIHAYLFSEFDPMYEADLAAGIHPLIIVTNAPKWAWPTDAPTSPGYGFPPGPEHLADWSAFLAAVATRYPQAAGIEIWNEPNHPTYWGRGYASHAPDPAYYSELLRVAYSAVKSVDPSMPVVGGALSNWQSTVPGGRISALEFATEMFRNGAAGYMDAISTHPYPQSAPSPDHTVFELGIDQMRAARATVGATTPIWLTEVGITTTGSGTQAVRVSETEQAAILADTFRWLTTQPDVDAFFIHTLTEPTQNQSDYEMGYAITRGPVAPFQPKPAFLALKEEAAYRPPPLVVGLAAVNPQPAARTGLFRVSASCNQDCAVTATGSVFVARKRRAAGRYALSRAFATGSGVGRVTLTLRLRAAQRRSLRAQLRRGLRATARIRVKGAAAGGSATSRIALAVSG